jgi:DNA-binding PadR family transcriptional regulator
MIELALLGLLREQDRHGYDLRKRMAELGAGTGISYGSLYPALSRLERNGYVRALAPGRAATAGPAGALGPMTGAITGELAALRHRKAARAAATTADTLDAGPDGEQGGGRRRADRRNRKVYRITDRGRERFDELLRTADPADERVFAVQVAFCGHLGADARLELLRRRRAALADQLAALTRLPAPAGDPATDRYRRSLREHHIQTIHHHLAWLDELAELTAPGGDDEPVTTTGGTTP